MAARRFGYGKGRFPESGRGLLPTDESPNWNWTPILVSLRQMILQMRVGCSDIAKLNFEGSPYVVWT
jgi:hypothetical protein